MNDTRGNDLSDKFAPAVFHVPSIQTAYMPTNDKFCKGREEFCFYNICYQVVSFVSSF